MEQVGLEGSERLVGDTGVEQPFGVVQYWLPAGVLNRIGVALPGTVSPMKAASDLHHHEALIL
jgi:hypothetical protein